MFWRKNLFLGEKVQALAKKRRRKRFSGLLLCLSLDPGEQIDIYPASVVRQRLFPREELYVIGLAADRAEALELVREIAEEAYQAMGDGDLRTYGAAAQFEEEASWGSWL